jgi:hypothetical protein
LTAAPFPRPQKAVTLGYDAVSVKPMAEPLSSEDGKLLIGLCRIVKQRYSGAIRGLTTREFGIEVFG